MKNEKVLRMVVIVTIAISASVLIAMLPAVIAQEQELIHNRLRLYGEIGVDALFPYTDAEAPFDPANIQSPRKDFITFNPAFLWHLDEHPHEIFPPELFLSGIKADGDANEKVFLRQWYVPNLKQPVGDAFGDIVLESHAYSDNIVNEYTYMLLNPDTLEPKYGSGGGSRLVFPISSRGDQIGLDGYDINNDGIPEAIRIDEINDTDNKSPDNNDYIKITGIPTTIEGFPVALGKTIEFLDYRVELVSLTENSATVNIYYIGNYHRDEYVGTKTIAFGEGVTAGKYTGIVDGVQPIPISRPFWVNVSAISADSATLEPHRLIKSGETFFVDGAEYDVAAIYIVNESLTGEGQGDEFMYITIRNPLPKYNDTLISSLTLIKKAVQENEILPMLPPFNYIHDIIDDINTSFDKTEERKSEDQNPLNISFVDEAREERFDTNLLEIYDNSAATGTWRWLHILTKPYDYTELIYPIEKLNTGASAGTYMDYLLTSSFRTPTDNRTMFVYTAINESDIYVNENVSYNTLRVYGEGNISADFPYTDPKAPFDLTSDEAPGRDFITFNPAFLWHLDENAHNEFGRDFFFNGIKADGDANEKVFLRQWYVPNISAPVGNAFGTVVPESHAPPSPHIVNEYTYMLLDPVENNPRHGSIYGTRLVFPISSRGDQIGLDGYDINNDSIPEAITFVRINDTDNKSPDINDTIEICAIPTSVAGMKVSVESTIEFLDYKVKLKSVGEASATIDIYYIGNYHSDEYVGTATLDLGDAVTAGRYATPNIIPGVNPKAIDRPFYVELTVVDSDFAVLTPHRLIKANEAFFVDGAEYDVAAIYIINESTTGEGQGDEFMYITIRNPLPIKENVHIPNPTITKRCVKEKKTLPLLPPFNYVHDIIDDIDIAHEGCYYGSDEFVSDDENINDSRFIDGPDPCTDRGDRVEERWVKDRSPLDIKFVNESIEKRFNTSLVQILAVNETAKTWEWKNLNITTLPKNYIEFVLPEGHGDYLLTSSFNTSTGERVKFVYDPEDGTGLYMNVDWNSWDDDGVIADIEIQEAVYCWLSDTPKNGHLLTDDEIQVLVYLWVTG